ncbi:TPA: LicD family protein [Citrobacter freundii]
MFIFIKKKISGVKLVYQLVKPIYDIVLGRRIFIRKQKRLSDNYLEALVSFDKAITKINKSYWLEFGTLLGAIREGGAIKHDTDIDMGMYLDEYSEDISNSLLKYGFKKIHELRSKTIEEAYEETYEYNGIHVDIFYFIKDIGSVYCYDFMREEQFSRELTINKFGGLIVRRIPLPFSNIGEIVLNGIPFPVPEPTAQHLISHYGKDYLHPNPGWTSAKNAESAIKIDYSGAIFPYSNR